MAERDDSSLFSTFADGYTAMRGPDRALPTAEQAAKGETAEFETRPQITDPREYRRRCVDVDPRQILREFTETSSHHAYWGKARADAKKVVDHCKIDRDEAKAGLERVEAILQLTIREEFLADPLLAEKVMGVDAKGKPKSPSEAVIKAKILTHPDYEGALESCFASQRELVEAQIRHDQLEVTTRAVAVKHDSLVQIGADRRAELRTDPSLRKYAKDRRDGDDDSTLPLG